MIFRDSIFGQSFLLTVTFMERNLRYINVSDDIDVVIGGK